MADVNIVVNTRTPAQAKMRAIGTRLASASASSNPGYTMPLTQTASKTRAAMDRAAVGLTEGYATGKAAFLSEKAFTSAAFSAPVALPENTTQGNVPFPVSLAMLEAWGKAPYSIYPQGSGYRAVNCEHDLSIRFAESGIQVCVTTPDTANLWDLALTRWGYGEALEAVPKATLEVIDNEIAYHRASLTEWYINVLSGLEQVIVLTEQLPNRTSDERLVLEFSFFEDGTRQIAADGQSVVWSRMNDAPTLVYRHLYAKDAMERDLPIQVEGVEETHTPIRYLRLRVDDQRAVYPITVARLIQQAAFIDGNVSYDHTLTPPSFWQKY